MEDKAKRLNILFLGGSKRVSIARMLKSAGRELGVDIGIFSYELDTKVPIAIEGPVIEGLRWADEGILEHIHDTVIDRSIDIIIPFVDPAIGVAARYRDTYGDVFVPVGSTEGVETMFDKIAADQAFQRAGLPRPELIPGPGGEPVFPVIAKPRHGSASQGIVIIHSTEELRPYIASRPSHLVQRYIANAEEYTVDCYVAMNGEIKVVSPRRRGEVSGGEVTTTVTVESPDIVNLTVQALKALDLRGAVTVQFIVDKLETDFKPMIMEINPRLGGGVVASVHAHADIPRYIIADALGIGTEPCDEIIPGTFITRYQQEVVFVNGRRQ
ncbi:MAG: ATP-grasp domain-containing protein [Muribaculaceae bacterium]|nr:ATP-grasp domain-containing protein [Muribaculaceae bacterium]